MLRSDEELVDVTLSCEGKRIRAHKMLLSACSTYFRDLFKVTMLPRSSFHLLYVSSTRNVPSFSGDLFVL